MASDGHGSDQPSGPRDPHQEAAEAQARKEWDTGGRDEPAEPGSSTTLSNQGVDRGVVIGSWLEATARWSLRAIIIGVGLFLALWLLGKVWVGVLPILLAMIVTTVLWPPVAFMVRHRVPPALAALVALLGSFAIIGGTVALVAPSVIDQSARLVEQAAAGIRKLQEWAAGPPINLENQQIESATEEAVNYLQGSSSQIAGGVFTGVAAVTSALVTLVLMLVLTFFFLKDGPAFLPWVRRLTGRNAGRHLTECSTRVWATISGFIRTQAVVSAVDAVFIGLGLVVLGVPLAGALAILTFFGGFIPIVGAFAVGALAVLVALVSNGWTTALLVLGLILLVQQIEGNVLQPFLQGRSMQLHAGIVLLAVAGGSTLFGVIGAFLAVPVAAAAATTLRYVNEQIDLRTADLSTRDVESRTPEGAAAALLAEHEARTYQQHARTHMHIREAATRGGEAGGGFLNRLRVAWSVLRDRDPSGAAAPATRATQAAPTATPAAPVAPEGHDQQG